MKNLKKALIAGTCSVLLVAGSVAGTMAYLTDTDNHVTNTFTVGKVVITLDEAPVGDDGIKDEGARVTANNYHLFPGHTYDKDPIVHVDAASEESYLFIKLTNEIAGIVDETDNIESQIAKNGWKELVVDGTKVNNVYYYQTTVSGKNSDRDIEVFENFKISSTVNNTTLENYNNKTIKVDAYAIQADGFIDAAAAWEGGNFN